MLHRLCHRLLSPFARRRKAPPPDITLRGLPLILISQVSRSGGTLLSQLFDDHPALLAHPGELKIGKPRKWNWPDLTAVRTPSEAFAILRDPAVRKRYAGGVYSKGGGDSLPIHFDWRLQEAVFTHLCEQAERQDERIWLNAYFESFFHAWLDHQRRYSEKRYICGFASMLALLEDNVCAFARIYPDGWLISVIREPLGWYASVKKRTQDCPRKAVGVEAAGIRPYAGFDAAEHAYLANADAMRRNRELLGDRLILLDYTDLTSEPECVMRTVAERIGIDWHPSLAKQTFNGMPIKPNTSFSGGGRRDDVLTDEDRGRIGSGPMMASYRAITVDTPSLKTSSAVRSIA